MTSSKRGEDCSLLQRPMTKGDAEMSADADISAGLFITERWSRQQSYPRFEHAILDFPITCLQSVR